jgi:hypothetical protein
MVKKQVNLKIFNIFFLSLVNERILALLTSEKMILKEFRPSRRWPLFLFPAL